MLRAVVGSKSLANVMAIGHAIRISSIRRPRFPLIKHLRLKSSVSSNSIILMGYPGSGKTTVGQILSDKLNLPFLDIDDHHLEPYWGMPVAKKLALTGPTSFLKEEGEAFLHFHCDRQSVIAMSGSNVMYPPAVLHAKKYGFLVYLDAHQPDIVRRLHAMKVDRIVHHDPSTPMDQVLQYRQPFYEGSYDIRIICEEHESAERIAEKVMTEYDRICENSMLLQSTRGGSQQTSFLRATLDGLAGDGGLYVQKNIPSFTIGQWERLVHLGYVDRGLRILEKWIHPHDDINPRMLKSMLERAYSASAFGCGTPSIAPVRSLGETPSVAPVRSLGGTQQHLLELFHGPTGSFKDLALQLMPLFFDYAVHRLCPNHRFAILVATSGDTGSAVLDGFSKHSESCRTMVLFPVDGVSPLQKHLLTSHPGEAVSVIGVKGDFDFCQDTIKFIFIDDDYRLTLKEVHGFSLSAANSINIARLLPQIVYHCSAYLDLVAADKIVMGAEIDMAIPTGNFGNILSAYYAKKMGVPIRRLICASNSNNILYDFFNTGVYDISHRKLQLTVSPAIDILKSSNLERFLFAISDGDSELVSKLFYQLKENGRFQIDHKLLGKCSEVITSGWCTEDLCKQEIQRTFQKHGYVLDPHTAVAKAVYERHSSNVPVVIASTAHYSKFSDTVNRVVNLSGPSNVKGQGLSRPDPQPHGSIVKAMKRPVVHERVLPAKTNTVKKCLFKFLS